MSHAPSPASIPSTPTSKMRISSQALRDLGGDIYDTIPETPQRPLSKKPPTPLHNAALRGQRASSESRKITPKKTLTPAQGDSPYDAIDVSSASEDSDCKIEKVQPSPNRKASKTGSVNPVIRRRENRAPSQDSRVHSSPVKQSRAPSSSAPARLPGQALIKASYLRKAGINTDVLANNRGEEKDSDCYIEKVLPSPNRRGAPKAPENKRVKARNSSHVNKGPATNTAASVTTHAPRKKSSAPDLVAREKPLPKTPQRTPAKKLYKTPSPAKSAQTPESIDLTALSSSDDSDSVSDRSDGVLAVQTTMASEGCSQDIGDSPGNKVLLTYSKQDLVPITRAPAPPITRPENIHSKKPKEAPSVPSSVHILESNHGQRERKTRIFKREPLPSPSIASSDELLTAQESQQSQAIGVTKIKSIKNSSPEIKLEALPNEEDGDSSPFSYEDSSDDENYFTPSNTLPDRKPGSDSLHKSNAASSSPPFLSPSPNKESSSDNWSNEDRKQEKKTRLPRYNVRNLYDASRVGKEGPVLPQSPATPLPYELKPDYSSDVLVSVHKPGESRNFKPRHRNTLIGLRSILRESRTCPEGKLNGKNVSFSPMRNASSPRENLVSSPMGRTQRKKRKGNVLHPTQRRLFLNGNDQATAVKKQPLDLKKQPRDVFAVDQQTPSIDVKTIDVSTEDNIARNLTRPIQSIVDEKKRNGLIPSARSSRHLSTSQAQPSVATREQEEIVSTRGKKRPLPSSSDLQPQNSKRSKVSTHGQPTLPPKKPLKPIPAPPSWVPKNRDFNPAIIRDRVSEHAIKPTVARLEQRIARGEVSVGAPQERSSSGPVSNTYWGPLSVASRQQPRAMAAELRHRGIKTARQYGNFWYNLTMAYSRLLANSPVPLFTAKKKAFEDFAEECMKNRRDLQPEVDEKPEEKPEGIDAFLLSETGDTDESPSTDSSSSSSDDEDEWDGCG